MTYQIQGFTNPMQYGCDAERTSDTLKDARRQAKYMLSDEYRRASEAADKLTLVQIWKGDVLIDEIT